MYFVKAPWWLKKLYSNCIWQIDTAEKIIYLTFDDGPHPQATAFVLDELKKYNAQATFFCIGKNVADYPLIYKRIIEEGHAVGNHTQHHLNGWKTNDTAYIKDIRLAKELIDSNLFRPPYGKISRFQLSLLQSLSLNLHTIMWSVLSGDFDIHLSKEKCADNVLKNTGKGSIVVFHDSEKAFERMQFALPRVLAFFNEKNFRFQKLSSKNVTKR